MTPKLAKYSWQTLHRTYAKLGEELQQYAEIPPRFQVEFPVVVVPGQIIHVPDGYEEFAMRFYHGVRKVNGKLSLLDEEIARRNKLIGVMG